MQSERIPVAVALIAICHRRDSDAATDAVGPGDRRLRHNRKLGSEPIPRQGFRFVRYAKAGGIELFLVGL
jgi:hypothetical protein